MRHTKSAAFIATTTLISISALAAAPALPAFEKLVTRAVIKAAVAQYGSYYHMLGYDGSKDKTYSHITVMTVVANDSIRFAVYDSQLGEDGAGRVGCALRHWEGCIVEPALVPWRASLLAAARAYLKDPSRLKGLYMAHKTEILEEVRAAGLTAPVKDHLTRAQSYFAMGVSTDVLVLNERYHAARKTASEAMKVAKARCYRDLTLGIGEPDEGMCDQKGPAISAFEQARANLQAATPDWMAMQWSLRRKAEGGDKLLRTYGEIMADLAHSL